MSVPVSTTNRNFNTIPFDPELTPGARNAVKVCLRVQPGEKVTVITDEATKEIAASMVRIGSRGCSVPRVGAGGLGAAAVGRSSAGNP
jgi:aminopeptidase